MAIAPTTSKDLAARMSKRLANFKLSNTVIEGIANRVMIDGLSIVWFNPCIYGICLEYVSDKPPQLDALTSKSGITKWEVFPYGIMDWDHFHVQVAYQVDELEGKIPSRGFGR